MAYAALVSLEQTIDKLLHHHNDQCPVSPHDKQQLALIHEFVSSLQAFLEKFPEKANNLEGRIRDLANETEDIIEFGMSDQIKLYHDTLKSTAGTESHVMLHCDFKDLNKVIKEIPSIRKAVMEIKNHAQAKDEQLSGYSSVATPSSRLTAPTNKDPVVGFDEDLMAIKLRLRGESQNLQFIPIFGMGGIGKTTLARNSFSDPLAMGHFDIRAWVTVSQDYTAKEIFSSLLASIEAERFARSIEPTVQNVYQYLKGRRYLIVIDDIWSTKAWDDIKVAFPDDRNRSRIILTTRLSEVATYPDPSSPIHAMRFMDADQSWNLLQQKVFPQKNCPPELETIGKTIATSCGGLPLAIVLIAGLLSTVSRTRASWENIAKSVKLANNEQLANILSLSYIRLPHHLRPCFLYMGGFPEDREIRAAKLIKLWVAEGFSKPSGSKSFEEVAEEYLEDLVKRSLIFVTRWKSTDKIKSCSVHDLVRDLCIRKAEEEMFYLNVRYAGKNIESIESQRRITISHSDIHHLEKTSASSIRTIICFHHDGSSLSSLGNARLLRVLDMVPKIEEGWTVGIGAVLPAEVFELFHLRYLAFTFREELIALAYTPGIQFVLPPSILYLQNLQTLMIRGRALLPPEIWRMQQLRHLKVRSPLPNIPQGAATFPLENLQTLSGVKEFKCTEEILKMIPNLKTLEILYPKQPREYVADYHLNNLVNLHRLEKLTLGSYSFGSSVGKLNPIFPRTLKKLTLQGQIIPFKDMGIVGSLPNLEVLKLTKYQFFEDKWETREGEFSQLKFLQIDFAHFQQWIVESSHFPCLKRLLIYYCSLKEIPDGIGEIPTLELILIGSNKSLLDSAKKLQEKQAEYTGYTTFEVREWWP